MRVLMGLSGGADSACAAQRLRDAGHEVAGVFLRLHDGAEEEKARYTAEKLDIPFSVIDAREAFERIVISDFLEEYARGRTPNPCALCNRDIKVRLLVDAARAGGYDRVATGHYARLSEEDGRFYVAMARDLNRDQSYFLWRLTQEELSCLIFPLAEETKQRLRTPAAALTAPHTAESRELCFVEDGDALGFLEAHLPSAAREGGAFVSRTGAVLGRHEGVYRYTVGQRRGLGQGFGERLYVCGIDAASRRVTLGAKEDCLSRACTLAQVNFQKAPPDSAALFCHARLRYRAKPHEAELTLIGRGTARLSLCGAGEIAAPGQSAVCYDAAGAVLCGGIIESATLSDS